MAKYTEPNSIVLPLGIMQDGQNMKTESDNIRKLMREQASAKPDPKKKKAQRSKPSTGAIFPLKANGHCKRNAESLRI